MCQRFVKYQEALDLCKFPAQVVGYSYLSRTVSTISRYLLLCTKYGVGPVHFDHISMMRIYFDRSEWVAKWETISSPEFFSPLAINIALSISSSDLVYR